MSIGTWATKVCLPVSVIQPFWFDFGSGWRFATQDEKDIPGENTVPDPLHEGFTHIRDVYFESDPNYASRFTVPTLYDKKQKKIVSNESSEIIRMFYHEFDDLLEGKYKELDLLPNDLKAEIEETNEWTYNDINNGVYKSGFATTQDAYEKAVTTLFKSLDRAEEHLAKSSGPYWHGDRVTEADVRLFTVGFIKERSHGLNIQSNDRQTIIRFDAVYVQHFKTNLRDIRSGYPALHK